MTTLYDAHNHLQDARLEQGRDAMLAGLRTAGIRAAVVNGTREDDWPVVADLARQHRWIRPAYGLHPWHVRNRSSDWLANLTARLRADTRASLGEVGLDRWVEGFDTDLQLECLRQQWGLAAREERVATLHCLRAWGLLVDFLHDAPPLRAFVLHSFAGSEDLVAGLVARGGYFSFSPYFLHERKAKQRKTFARIPLDRLLIETDAPDMVPPPELNVHPLTDARTSRTLNHPLNLSLTYQGLADLRMMQVDELAQQVEANFLRVFGP